MYFKLDKATYFKLKQLASVFMRNERVNHTLTPTALVNETYLRLHASKMRTDTDHSFFLATAARSMRQILIDHARAKNAQRRGGDVVINSLHDDEADLSVSLDVDLIALDTVLRKLEHIDETKVRIVEMRYFGGMTLEEISAELNISVATAKRKWTAARAWLYRELSS